MTILTHSATFVKSYAARDIMLQISEDRPAHAGDIVLTECPDAMYVSPKSAQPESAGYFRPKIKVGCRKCEICEQEYLLAQVSKWSQRIKAVLTYEIERRDSTCWFITFTFPKHLTRGIPEHDYAPTEDMLQTEWQYLRRRIAHWYSARGVKVAEALNQITFVERGTERGRLHLHGIFCLRPDFPHPTDNQEAVFLRTEWHRDKDTEGKPYGPSKPVNIYGDGFALLWSDLLADRGYERLQAYDRRAIESPAQTAGYCVSAYLTKGFADTEIIVDDTGDVRKRKRFKVRAGHQELKWPELLAWHRDKRYELGNREYRRWAGFKVEIKYLDDTSFRPVVKRLVSEYTELYRRAVSVAESPMSATYTKVHRHNLPVKAFEQALLRRLSEYGNRHADNRRLLGQPEFQIPMSVILHPVLLALSDREVLHPARAEYLTCAQFYPKSETFALPYRLNQPAEHIDSRLNLCGASHWWPLEDGKTFDITETEAFRELAGWHMHMSGEFDGIVKSALNETFPGYAESLMQQGMPRPYDIVNESAVRRMVASFPRVFSDDAIAAAPIAERDVEVAIAFRPPPPEEEIAESLEARSRWPEVSSIPARTRLEVHGNWPEFNLKHGQLEVMARIEQGLSGVYCLPTSFGKSICYQGVAPQSPGITLVISPLLSLIRDQVKALWDMRVNATYLAGPECASEYQRDKRLGHLLDLHQVGAHGILYCSPEALSLRKKKDGSYRFLSDVLIEGSLEVAHLVLDEVHCISQWSDFRRCYGRISEYMSAWKFLPTVLSAFSATISPRLLYHIREEFAGHFPSLPFYAVSCIRPNLILRRSSHIEFTDFFATSWADVETPCLVFCGDVKNTERIANSLVERGVSALPYHARLPNKERLYAEEAFRDGYIDVLCATVAYGMGIDKSDIRTVIHAEWPDNLERYLQEIGRAGRDGGDADCILLNSPGIFDVYQAGYFDARRRQNDDIAQFYAEKLVQHEDDVLNYFRSPHCLWHHLALMMGQPGWNCGRCDTCTGLSPFRK